MATFDPGPAPGKLKIDNVMILDSVGSLPAKSPFSQPAGFNG
jgi:hypothetical protein